MHDMNHIVLVDIYMKSIWGKRDNSFPKISGMPEEFHSNPFLLNHSVLLFIISINLGSASGSQASTHSTPLLHPCENLNTHLQTTVTLRKILTLKEGTLAKTDGVD